MASTRSMIAKSVSLPSLIPHFSAFLWSFLPEKVTQPQCDQTVFSFSSTLSQPLPQPFPASGFFIHSGWKSGHFHLLGHSGLASAVHAASPTSPLFPITPESSVYFTSNHCLLSSFSAIILVHILSFCGFAMASSPVFFLPTLHSSIYLESLVNYLIHKGKVKLFFKVLKNGLFSATSATFSHLYTCYLCYWSESRVRAEANFISKTFLLGSVWLPSQTTCWTAAVYIWPFRCWISLSLLLPSTWGTCSQCRAPLMGQI